VISFFKSPENKIKFVFWSLLSLVVVMPLAFGGNRPVPWSIMSLITGLLLVIWGIAANEKRELSRVSLKHIWFFVIPFVIVMLWIPLQIFLLNTDAIVHPIWQMTQKALDSPTKPSITLDVHKTAEGFMKLLTYGMIFWLSLQVGRSPPNAKKLITAIAIAGGFYALYGIIVYTLGNEHILWYNKTAYYESLTSTFVNRNSYATYAGIGLIVSLALFFTKLLKNADRSNMRQLYITLINNFTTKSALFLLIVLLLIASLIMSNSRAGLVSASIGCISFIGLFTLTKAAKSHRFILGISSLILVSVFIIALALGGDAISKRFSKLDQEIEARGNIYSISVSAIKDFAILGSGLGTFENTFSMYRDSRLPNQFLRRVDHAHNTYLETVIELGMPAFILLTISIFSILVVCFKGLINREQDAMFPAIALATSAIIWTHALFDFSIEMPAISITYSTILGVGCAQSWSIKKSLSDRLGSADE